MLGQGGGTKLPEAVMRLDFDAPEARAQALEALQALLVRARRRRCPRPRGLMAPRAPRARLAQWHGMRCSDSDVCYMFVAIQMFVRSEGKVVGMVPRDLRGWCASVVWDTHAWIVCVCTHGAKSAEGMR